MDRIKQILSSNFLLSLKVYSLCIIVLVSLSSSLYEEKTEENQKEENIEYAFHISEKVNKQFEPVTNIQSYDIIINSWNVCNYLKSFTHKKEKLYILFCQLGYKEMIFTC